MLAADALLLTAATFAAVTGALALIVGPGPTEPTRWVEGLSAVITLGSVVAGPVLAWRLHGRRVTWPAVAGGALGALAVGVLASPLLLVVAGLGMLVSWVTGSELAGPVTVLSLAGAGLGALAVWLLRDAVRDLAPARREHVALDRVRVVAVAALAVVVAGSVVWAVVNPGDESVELVAFAALAGVTGVAIALGAEAVTALAARRGR
jgi:hypothetical protein